MQIIERFTQLRGALHSSEGHLYCCVIDRHRLKRDRRRLDQVRVRVVLELMDAGSVPLVYVTRDVRGDPVHLAEANGEFCYSAFA